MAASDTVKSRWLDASGAEPIAIIGVGCRFSGTASDEDGLWQLLSSGRTSWANNARSRFKLESFWHPNAHLSGSTNARGIHLLNQDPAVFDNDFFGISGVEAKAIDPQQRLMLEVAYETFENAGIPLEKLEGSNTGVYTAVSYTDYDLIQTRDPEVSPLYRFTGTGPSLISNRVNYVFDLHGPSKSVDTACSSTLVALHDAIHTLRAGDADQMLVGGSNMILDPDKLTVISSMQFLSPDGRCYSFDSRASGYARGEGVVAILLKPLSAALRDGDHIRSIIRGSAIVSDGKTPGITMPSPEYQFNAIRRAYETAGLDPRETVYVEAHGTGTNAGDDCEATAFSRAFCTDRPNKLLVGSVKANLGHTECVSGLAGLVKILLMLEKGAIVPNPTFATANPKLHLDQRGIAVPTKYIPWPEGCVRRASINGSGYGGTNGHVILEAFTDDLQTNGHASLEYGTTNPNVFVWTHQREDGFAKLAASWTRFILASRANNEELSLDDLAFTLSSRRSLFSNRVAVVASNYEQLLEGLKSIKIGSTRPVKTSTNPRVCYIFTGQGAQWAHMGLELMSHPVFAQSMRLAEQALIDFGASWHLIDELQKDSKITRINEAELAQPCCTAVQIALTDLLESWGVQPDLVCGHSSGEIGAAYAAGGLNARDALKVAFFRGRAVQFALKMNPERRGGMLAVGLSETDARNYLASYDQEVVTVACINSPSSVTLSGDASAIQELAVTFDGEGVFNRQLVVAAAYHSSHMSPIQEYYQSLLQDIQPRKVKPHVRMVSSVTCQDVQGQELGASYWVRNLLCPVRFSDTLSKCLRTRVVNGNAASTVPPAMMIEIGPHSALRGPALQIAKAEGAQNSTKYFSCLQRKQDAFQTAMSLAGDLFTNGVPIALDIVNNPHGAKRHVLTSLPSYSWHHNKSYWTESRRSEVYRKRKFARHDLLGSATADSITTEPSWRMYIRLSEMPWIKGHCVDGQVVFSAAGFVTMAIEALKRQCAVSKRPWKGVIHLKQIILDRALLIQDDAFGAEVFTMLRPYAVSSREISSKWQEFRIYSVSQNNESTEHCRGLIGLTENVNKLSKSLKANGSKKMNDDADMWTSLEPKALYKQLGSFGNGYSGYFANLKKITARPWESRCDLIVPDVKSSMPSGHQLPHHLHPTTLEGCFQSVLPGVKLADMLDAPQVVTTVDEIFITTDLEVQPGQTLSVAVHTAPHGLKQHSSEIEVTGVNESTPIIRVSGIKFTTLGSFNQTPESASEDVPLCHNIQWLPDPLASLGQSLQKYCSANLIYRNQQLRKTCDPFVLSLVRASLAQMSEEEKGAVTGHVQWFLKWMLDQDISSAKPVTRSGENKTLAVGAAGEMLVKLGPYIKDILLGRAETVPLLLKDDLLFRLYFEDDCLNRCHAQLAQYLKLMQFKVPNLRILEVGGGTGSLTLPLLDALYGDDSARHLTTKGTYVFTDVSTSFTSKMQQKVKKYEAYMDFKRLDIEQPPEPQGFELGTFDVIVASNVIHATHSIGKTLSNLKPLLKPGGQIAIAELTEPSLRWGILGGGITGWWMGVNEGRTSSPMLHTTQWDEVFIKSGFSGVSLELRDYESDEEHEVSLLISHAVNTELKASVGSISILTRTYDNVAAAALGDGFIARYPGTEVAIIPFSQAQPGPGTYVVIPEANEDSQLPASEQEWEDIQHILSEANSVLWVTKQAAGGNKQLRRSLVQGLGRRLRSQNKDLNFFTLDLDAVHEPISESLQFVFQTYDKYLGPSASPYSASEWEAAVQDGNIVIPRLLEEKIVNNWVSDTVSKYHPREEINIDENRALGLRINTVGVLGSLYWADDEIHSKRPQSNQVRVRLENFALNHRDMLTATGQLEGQSALLLEGSGTVVELGDASKSSFSIGDRVCFFGPDGLATVSNIDAHHAVAIPADVPWHVAAAIPLAYTTALFGLRDIARLKKGDSVLIHSGAGAVGQAAIIMAKYLGARDIFATAGTRERRAFITQKFGIPANRVLSNKTSGFGDKIRELTKGRGVDIVLNSLSGDALAESCSAVAYFGRIIHLGKKDVISDGRLEMKHLEKNVTFSVVDMSLLAKERPKQFSELIKAAVKLVGDKTLGLIGPISVHHALRLDEHLREMQAGESSGKHIFRLESSLPLKVQPQKPKLAALSQDSSYMVAGRGGHVDRGIVKYLAKLGAKRIVMLLEGAGDRSGIEIFVTEVERLGAELFVIQGNISSRTFVADLEGLIQDTPIRGIIMGDLTIQEADTKDSGSRDFDEIVSSANGIMSLQSKLGSHLDFFILLSSTSSLVGTSVRDASAAESAFRSSYAQYQSGRGCSVTSINLVKTPDDNLATENESLPQNGAASQTMDEVLAVINYAIQRPANDATQGQIVCGAKYFNPELNPLGSAKPRPDARFSHVWSKATRQQTKKDSHDAFDAQSALRAASTPAAATDATFTGLKQKLATLLAISAKEIQQSRSVASYGVDSLIAAELRNWITSQLGGHVQMLELMSSMTLIQLAEVVAKRSTFVPQNVFADAQG